MRSTAGRVNDACFASGGAWKSTYSHAYQSLNAVLATLHVLNFETMGNLDDHGTWIPSNATEDNLRIVIEDDEAVSIREEKHSAKYTSTMWRKLARIAASMLPTFALDFVRWFWRKFFVSELAINALARLKGVKDSESSQCTSNMQTVTHGSNKCTESSSGKLARIEDLQFMIHVRLELVI